MSAVRVALVLVSHSDLVARGTAQIAEQMAPDVTVVAAGGIQGRIGTSVDRVLEAVTRAWDAVGDDPTGAGVVVLTDLGSAVLTAETVVELLDDDMAGLVRVPDAPIVEGAVAAAVQAQLGGDVDEVEAAAVLAGTAPVATEGGAALAPGVGEGAGAEAAAEEVVRTAVLRNPLGLHARPAAVVARAVALLDTPVRVQGAHGASVLELMRLGAVGGTELTVRASGPGAQHAVDTVADLLESGFGEI